MKGSFALFLAALAPSLAAAPRSLDGTWEFRKADGSAWRNVTVPHDWVIENAFPAAGISNSGKIDYKARTSYRRIFRLTEDERALLAQGGTAYLRFGGVQCRPEVRLNGVRVGGSDYGYVSFTLDVTAALREENVLEVDTDSTELVSRWYPGGGIYRSVSLDVKPREHVVPDSVAIVATPSADASSAAVSVSYISSLYGPTNFSLAIASPRLWSVDDPALNEVEILGERFRYGIRTAVFTANDGFLLNGRRLQLKGVNLHSDGGPLGLAFSRTAARRQLLILKDMGVNAIRMSHNPPDAQFLDLCDELGFVVWDECFDKWDATAARRGENLEDYVSRNLRAFVRRDRNHPCVVIWSIGNEISAATAEYPAGVTRARCRLFRDVVRGEDPTRPVGIGAWEGGTAACFADLDVTGWNYARRYLPIREMFPDKPIVYSESASSFSDNGFYRLDLPRSKIDYALAVRKTDGHDLTACEYSDVPDVEFHRVEKDSYLAGEFVWTGFDYLGEPSPYSTGFHNALYKDAPMADADFARSSYFGIVDLTGVPKDRYYLYRSYWNRTAETVHLLPHWNWKPGDRVPVFAYTSGDSADLFLNGRLLGRRTKLADLDFPLDPDRRDNAFRGGVASNAYFRILGKYRLMWLDVPYEPGELSVVAYREGRPIGTARVRTAGEPTAVRLALDPYSSADDDLVYVRVELSDAAGVRCPEASDRLAFSIEGDGRIESLGNSDPRDHDSFKAVTSHRLAFGRALAIVRRTGPGPIVLTAEDRARTGVKKGEIRLCGSYSD
jgi:beta-galactosidase